MSVVATTSCQALAIVRGVFSMPVGCAAGTVFPVSVAQMLSLATTTPRRFLTTANAFIWMHVECAVAMAFLQGNVTAKAMFWTIVKFAEATISQGASVAPIQTRATTIRWP